MPDVNMGRFMLKIGDCYFRGLYLTPCVTHQVTTYFISYNVYYVKLSM